MPKETPQYLHFRRRIDGEMNLLNKYKQVLMPMYAALFPKQEVRENQMLIDEGILESWAGVVISILNKEPAGFVTYSEARYKVNTLLIDVAYVYHDYRNAKIWSNCLGICESEAKILGVNHVVIHTSVDFLRESLKKRGYADEIDPVNNPPELVKSFNTYNGRI